MVENIDDVKSVEIDLCMCCGGWISYTTSRLLPGKLVVHGLTATLHAPTDRALDTYLDGACLCWDGDPRGPTEFDVDIGEEDGS